jgi:hypothetical protein
MVHTVLNSIKHQTEQSTEKIHIQTSVINQDRQNKQIVFNYQQFNVTADYI